MAVTETRMTSGGATANVGAMPSTQHTLLVAPAKRDELVLLPANERGYRSTSRHRRGGC